MEILCKDKTIDQILVLLTPQRTTEIEKTAQIIEKYARNSDKNIVASFVGGKKTFIGKKYLAQKRIPHFEFPADATKILGILANREKQLLKKSSQVHINRLPEIASFFDEAKEKKIKIVTSSTSR